MRPMTDEQKKIIEDTINRVAPQLFVHVRDYNRPDTPGEECYSAAAVEIRTVSMVSIKDGEDPKLLVPYALNAAITLVEVMMNSVIELMHAENEISDNLDPEYFVVHPKNKRMRQYIRACVKSGDELDEEGYAEEIAEPNEYLDRLLTE